MNNVSNDRVMDAIKKSPIFSQIIEGYNKKEEEKEQRQADIPALKAVMQSHREANARQAPESAEAREKILQCQKALELAKEEAGELHRKHSAESYEYEKKRGELEHRLRQSAPKQWYDRLDQIRDEMNALSQRKFTATEFDLRRGRATSPDLRDANIRMEELLRERDEINRKILEEEGEDNNE